MSLPRGKAECQNSSPLDKSAGGEVFLRTLPLVPFCPRSKAGWQLRQGATPEAATSPCLIGRWALVHNHFKLMVMIKMVVISISHL